MEINFCRRCAKPVTKKSEGFYVCPAGHSLFYKMYNGATIVLLNQQDEVLVAVRGQDPGKGTLDLPGGFLDPGETPLEAIHREIEEETGYLKADYDTPEFLCWATDMYEFEGETHEVLATVLWARLRSEKPLAPGDDVASLHWMPLESIQDSDIYSGFGGVRKALQTMRQRFHAS
ncbi:MAG TPA: NUDIX domain-containing protein [Candidatus Saccharimonadales bacterium]|nr:NUDIX domain-containing protein [Candidatus Saccharimonadales bacterium]